MGYFTIKNAIPYESSQHGWQLRVHVAAEAIDKNNENNKFAVIKQCLMQVFNNDQLNIKVYQIANPRDQEEYDGAMAMRGKDRTQMGKEICIYMPNVNTQQLNSAEYQHKLLILWKLLQTNKVPLLHFNAPGDQSINISNSTIPSPFSFTSLHPERDEWKDKHGILFKHFVAHGSHPILRVNFSIDDLIAHNIELEKPLTKSYAFLTEHRVQIQSKINQQLQLINEQKDYQEFLASNEKTKDLLKSLVNEYQCKMRECGTLEERELLQDEFIKALEANEDYQYLINAYPHENDSEFSENPSIGEIKLGINGQLTEERIDEIIDGLRWQYADKIAEIIDDFHSESISFDNFNITQLINSNPAAMQCIFRQQALISQENTENELINSGTIALKVALLNSYKAERDDKAQKQYFSVFGFFSRAFGAWSKNEKFAAVDALIEVLQSNGESVYLDKKLLGPLQQGTLGKLVEKLELDVNAMLMPAEGTKLLA